MHLEYAFVVDLVFKGPETAVEFLFQAETIAKTELANVENQLDEFSHLMRHVGRNVVIAKSGNERCVLMNRVFDDFELWNFRDSSGGGGRKRLNGFNLYFPVPGNHSDQHG